ncbi:hypothetical protein [Geminocystis sp. GBBB08]|uniref:hypothetical protein n=1 Tax=Geminocystis sp. GBBB08 TaxID=2604140 RepID=UPI0027E3740C|nr:hypothetical protein [Geminocystis sp. GBBB08]MBL1209445.1 hypothetical protein [Geminocystis sp. GBBB08]
MAKKRNKKFTDIWSNLTNLGKIYGLSAIKMGKKLKELGLRNDEGKPTEKALLEGFAQSTPLKDGSPFYMWHKHKILELMRETGFQKLDENEILAQDLAKEWIKINQLYEEAISGFEEEGLFMEAEEIRKTAIKKGLIPKINEILTEKKFKGEKITP